MRDIDGYLSAIIRQCVSAYKLMTRAPAIAMADEGGGLA